MHRRSVLLSVLSGALTSVVASRQRTSAQEATPVSPTDLAAHPIVGAWKWTNDPSDPHPESFAIFHADGTYVESIANNTGIGVWQPTGPQGAMVTAYFQDMDSTTAEVDYGRTTMQGTITLETDAKQATIHYDVVKDSLDGYRIDDGQGLIGTLTRLTILPLPTPTRARSTKATPTP